MQAWFRGGVALALCLGSLLMAQMAQARVVARVLAAPARVAEGASDARIDGAGRLIIVGARDGGRRAIGRLIVRRRLASGAADLSFGRRGLRVVHAVSGGTGFAVGPMALWRRHIVVAGAIAAGDGFEACWVVRLHADGRRDESFAGDGIARFGRGKSSLFPPVHALLVGRRGSVYVAGACGSEGVVKLRPNGTLDPRFGVGGLARAPFSDGSGVAAMRLDHQGHLLVVANNGTGYEVARLKRNGVLDHSFGNDGFASTIFPGRSGTATSLLVQTDGRIVVSGWCYESAYAPQDVCLARYGPDGAPDVSFGNDGSVMTQFVRTDQADQSGSDQQPTSAVVTRNGTIVVGGIILGAIPNHTRTSRTFVAEYRADGHLRQRFFAGGWLVVRYRHTTTDMLAAIRATMADGPIYTVGTATRFGTPPRIEVARLVNGRG